MDNLLTQINAIDFMCTQIATESTLFDMGIIDDVSLIATEADGGKGSSNGSKFITRILGALKWLKDAIVGVWNKFITWVKNTIDKAKIKILMARVKKVTPSAEAVSATKALVSALAENAKELTNSYNQGIQMAYMKGEETEDISNKLTNITEKVNAITEKQKALSDFKKIEITAAILNNNLLPQLQVEIKELSSLKAKISSDIDTLTKNVKKYSKDEGAAYQVKLFNAQLSFCNKAFGLLSKNINQLTRFYGTILKVDPNSNQNESSEDNTEDEDAQVA